MSRPRKPVRLCRIRGKPNWYIRDGRTLVSTSSEDEGEAQCALNDYLTLKDTPRQPSIAVLLDRRLSFLKGKARYQNTTYYHAALKDHFGSLQASQITRGTVSDYRGKRAIAPTSLREELMELRSTLAMAMRDDLISRVPYIELPAKKPPRERFMTRAEGKMLMEAAGTIHLRLYLVIAMSTGARKGAILGLTWDRVDMEHGRIDFTDPDMAITKKRRTVVPVGRGTLTALRNARQFAETDYVIEYMGKPIKNIRRTFMEAAETAGLPWVTPHILKHSVISWLAEDGCSVDQISDLTATHRNTVLRVYRKFNPDYLKKVVDFLDQTVSFGNQFAKLAN